MAPAEFGEWPLWTGQILVAAVGQDLAAHWGALWVTLALTWEPRACRPDSGGHLLSLLASVRPRGCIIGAEDTTQPLPSWKQRESTATQSHKCHVTERERPGWI